MSDMHDYYFGQLVQEDELDEGFAYLEQADWDQYHDIGFRGICIPAYNVPAVWPALPNSWFVEQAAPPSWDVSIDTGYAYDKDGKRMAVDPPTTVLKDCTNDYLTNPNAVVIGDTRIISIFLRYTKAPSDPRTDDLGATVYFMQSESYELVVYQSAPATLPALPTPPTLISDGILLADIVILDTTGATGILNAHIDTTTRTERLVNLDLSALQPAAYTGGLTHVRGRNLDEILYSFMDMLMDIPTEGQLPKTTCAYDLGSTALRWKQLWTQAIDEKPDDTDSGASLFQPNDDWQASGDGHSGATKNFTSMGGGWDPEYRDEMARRRVRVLEETEDFLYYNGHAGPWPFTLGTVGLGAAVFNPGAMVGTYYGGNVYLSVQGIADVANIRRQAWPLDADLEPSCEWGLLPIAAPGNQYIEAGLEDTGGGIFVLIYDPTGAVLTAPSPNWYCLYDDGVNAVVEIDTGIVFAAGNQVVCEVAFEQNVTSSNWEIHFYLTTGGTTTHKTFDLTAGLFTYEAQALSMAWDIICHFQGVGAGLGDLLADWYRVLQFRTN